MAARASPAVALAPLAVEPSFHGSGIGGALIREAHIRLQGLPARRWPWCWAIRPITAASAIAMRAPRSSKASTRARPAGAGLGRRARRGRLVYASAFGSRSPPRGEIASACRAIASTSNMTAALSPAGSGRPNSRRCRQAWKQAIAGLLRRDGVAARRRPHRCRRPCHRPGGACRPRQGLAGGHGARRRQRSSEAADADRGARGRARSPTASTRASRRPARHYLYRIIDRRAPPALERGRVWWVPQAARRRGDARGGAAAARPARLHHLPLAPVPGASRR